MGLIVLTLNAISMGNEPLLVYNEEDNRLGVLPARADLDLLATANHASAKASSYQEFCRILDLDPEHPILPFAAGTPAPPTFDMSLRELKSWQVQFLAWAVLMEASPLKGWLLGDASRKRSEDESSGDCKQSSEKKEKARKKTAKGKEQEISEDENAEDDQAEKGHSITKSTLRSGKKIAPLTTKPAARRASARPIKAATRMTKTKDDEAEKVSPDANVPGSSAASRNQNAKPDASRWTMGSILQRKTTDKDSKSENRPFTKEGYYSRCPGWETRLSWESPSESYRYDPNGA